MEGSVDMDCIICGLFHQEGTRWVARESEASAFAPLDPLAPGHTVVVPNAHYVGIFDLPPEGLAATMALVQQLAHRMRRTLDAGGVNILSASGPGSEQSVPHFHVHLVPRWPGDGFSTWPTGSSAHPFVGDAIDRLAQGDVSPSR